MQEYYLYRHIRLDTNLPFYIGKGSTSKYWKEGNALTTKYSRAYEHGKKDRSKKWHEIVSNIKYKVEIILVSDDENYILKQENYFVRLYNSCGIDLINKKHGGRYIC